MEEEEIVAIIRKYKNNLVIDIDHNGGHDISMVTFYVGGKHHTFSTKQISQFFDYITEGFFE